MVNRYSNKPLPKFFYTHGLGHLSILIKSASFLEVDINMTGPHTENQILWSVQLLIVTTLTEKPHPLGPGMIIKGD